MSNDVVDNLSPEQRYRHIVVSSLHNWIGLDGKPNPPELHWTPHPSQFLVLESIFKNDCKNVFVQCGRKWGKTEVIVYSLWRWALLTQKQSCYYICREAKQAREIIWKARDKRGRLRLQEFGPADFIQDIDDEDMRITFKNGSFLKVDGSDNYRAWAGISPNFLVLDEFADFRPEFWRVMNPNRATFNAPVVIIGTPPVQIWLDKDTPHQYVELAHEYQLDMFESGRSFHIKRPSWDNPDPVIQEFLRHEKKALFRMGKQDEWWRDYGAELVNAGAKKVFPGFISDPSITGSHVLPHSAILDAMYH